DRYRIKKYADLYGTDRKPSKENLLSFLVNPKIVEEIMKIPGQRYKCPHGKVNAAITIQSQWRGYKLRADYKNTVEKKWACGIIAFSWTLRAKMKEIRIKLSQTRADNLEIHTHKFKAFKLSWHRIQNSKRVIVHLPSLGYPEYVRSNMKFLHTQENIQISRICEIADPNVDVIYLSPDHVTEEAKAYYDKLLALRSAVISGNVEKIKNVENRVTYIVPEIISSYPCMNMCLATLMKYSPKAVERVKKLVKGREAYIVPGAVYLDDLDVARQLNLPILGPDPQTAHLYSTKSGVKQIFLKSRVNTPPGASNIYNEEQLKECLAKLIIENLSIRKWVFKFDVSVSSNGIAYCNVMDLKCYNWILNESLRMGKSWSLKWAHAASTNLLLNELPQFLKHCVSPVNKSSYCVWDIYKQYFFARGGIVEAYPPTEVFTAIEVDLLVVPSGKNEILCSGDQILSSQPFDPWGLSVPQCSIEPPDLNEACYRIAKECKSKGIYGYVSVCFLTFFKDPKSKQILWAIDMRIGYSNSLAMFQLMKYISNCYFDAEKHEIIIDRPSKDSSKAGTDNSRYGVFSTKLYHSNLSIIHYSVFFHMCRAFGIGYDIKEKQGTVFTVFDYLARNFIGMLVVSNDLRNALITFARNLNTLHAEVSGSRTKQSTNFMEAVASIQEIIRITGVVEQDETMKENNSKTKT
ncbi:IQ domain-containing protein H-like, partial [Argonauta hians]